MSAQPDFAFSYDVLLDALKKQKKCHHDFDLKILKAQPFTQRIMHRILCAVCVQTEIQIEYNALVLWEYGYMEIRFVGWESMQSCTTRQVKFNVKFYVGMKAIVS